MKIKGSRKLAVLKMILVVNVLLAPIQTLAQNSGFAITPIVKRGDAVSDGGRFFDCKGCEGFVVGLHALNNQGDVAIGADVVDGCNEGRFILSAGKSIRLADFCRITEFGKFSLLGPVNLNDKGQGALLAGPLVDGRIIPSLFLFSNGQLTKIVQEGDRTPIGTIFKGCGFGQPAINNNGDVAFFACGETDEGFFFGDGVFKYSNGEITKVVVGLDPSPVGGTFALNFIPAQPVQMNDNGDILFRADVIFDEVTQKVGLFLATSEGFKKILFDGDPMPGGGVVMPKTFSNSDLNDKANVAFSVRLTGGQSDSGIFLYSNDRISKIMAEGDPSPIGGKFSPLVDPNLREDFPTPRINDNGAVAFKVRVTDGSAPSAIFLASPQAIIKVAAVGDKLPTGGKIKEITTFALNDFGQVAFYADVKNGPKGVFLATPLQPTIKKVKLKRRNGSLQLIIKGAAMITNDSVIEVNGVALGALSYPEEFREDGGTSRRVISRDNRLEELIPEGQPVEVTIHNRLTNLRSSAKTFTR